MGNLGLRSESVSLAVCAPTSKYQVGTVVGNSLWDSHCFCKDCLSDNMGLVNDGFTKQGGQLS